MDFYCIVIKLLLFFSPVLFFSCEREVRPRPVRFPVHGTSQVLLGMSSEAVQGQLDFSRPNILEYEFASLMHVPPPVSLEIEYSFRNPLVQAPRIIVEIGDNAWVLPVQSPGNSATTGIGSSDEANVFHYAIPVHYPFPQQFSIIPSENSTGSVMHIRSITIRERWYGFHRLHDSAGDRLFISPFVSRNPGDAWVIDLAAASAAGLSDAPAGFFSTLTVNLQPGQEGIFSAGNRHFTALPQMERLTIPVGIITPDTMPLVLSGDRIASFQLL